MSNGNQRFDWLSEYLARLHDQHVLVRSGSAVRLAPAHWIEIDLEDWGKAAAEAAGFDCRWAALWGDHQEADGEQLIVLHMLLERAGDYVAVRTEVPVDKPVLPSQAPFFPAAERPERHLHDLLGVVFQGPAVARRWTRHQAWSESEYPLRRDFPVAGNRPAPTPPDNGYPFERIQGSGVYEIPVGPVHAGIIEPGHFRFQAMGEEVLQLEERLGYVHKGIEKIAVGRDPEALVRLAGRVSGDSTVAHAWAASQGLERAAGCKVPPRALYLRALLCERERVANHLGDIGAICNDVGFAFAHYQFSRLRERWQRRNMELFGHRLLMDRIVPGGVATDIEPAQIPPLLAEQLTLDTELEGLFDILEDHPSLDDRLLTTGYLAPDTARRLGAVGYVGRASGQGFDLRRDNPYPPYDTLEVEVPLYSEGDVAARVRVRMEEIRIALRLMEKLLQRLPEGGLRAEWPAPRAGEGLGAVEGWRGEVVCYVRLDEEGKVARYFPRDPSWLTWPTLEQLIAGNIVPDFPVCNKSVNGSYSGHDL
jgi:Ni,Fe-hydrogenase III large subunit/Ni,Fe-hydrogenase III component G